MFVTAPAAQKRLKKKTKQNDTCAACHVKRHRPQKCDKPEATKNVAIAFVGNHDTDTKTRIQASYIQKKDPRIKRLFGQPENF